MAHEIERKFLVTGDGWRAHAEGVLLRQGYLTTGAGPVVRVRLAGNRAWVTIKGPTVGLRRLEFEYEIPTDDAATILDELCLGAIIEKHRHRIEFDGCIWEVDEFHGANAGLVIAEIELDHESQAVELPPWVGREVSEDPRYSNSNLVARPYSTW